ncbi:response regulator [Fulvivirgaceae bacterium PWU5]|uniref:histidine kinase n=1 Tax=Dawidia cretensis TaxID=2782350 RepID=A0AAP2GUY8_9BACT|nr:ATP-binding protein [Dawidia cretensis]MBT1708177.1 response regulator [Dawidia cretensis]
MEPTTYAPRTLHNQYTLSIITPVETFTLQGPWHLDPEDGQPLKEDLNRLPISFDLLIALDGIHYLVHPDDVMALQDIMVRLRSGKSSDYHCRIIHSSGYTRMLHGFGTLQLPRRKMARALRENQELMETVLHTSPLPLMTLRSIRDEQGTIIDFEYTLGNAASEKLTHRELPGKRMLQEFPYTRSMGLFDDFINTVETGLPLDREHFYNEEGFNNWYRWIAVRLHDGVCVMVEDVTFRRQSLQQKHELETMAAVETARTAFFSNVSHEFRTPLTLLLNPLEEMLEHGGRFTTEDTRKLQMAHRNALRLQKLVNTLLDLSRIEAGQVVAAYRPTNLSQFTADIAATFQPAMEKAGLMFTIDIPTVDTAFYIDHDMWEKIVLNLLSNAFKFTLEGSVTVTMRFTNDTAVFGVHDTGPGIAADAIPQIFERFGRIEGMPARIEESSGLGLALVKEMVVLHGGSIHVESTPGEGAHFYITIPAGKDHLPPYRIQERDERVPRSLADTAAQWQPQAELPQDSSPIETDQSDARKTSRPVVLLAEDHRDMRTYLTDLLKPHYTVLTAENGIHALSLLREGMLPDLVLADVLMPGLDGLKLMQTIHESREGSHIPVILLSAHASEKARLEGLQQGADDYLIKPFSPRELLARVKTRLELAQTRTRSERQLKTVNHQLEQRILERSRALQESYELLSGIFEGVQVNLSFQKALRDGQGTVKDFILNIINPAFLKSTGLTEQARGRHLSVLFPDIRTHELWHRMEEVLYTGKPQRFETRYSYSGAESWQDISLVKFGDGVISSSLPITERKRAEVALRHQKDLYKKSLDAIPHLVWVYDLKTGATVFNDQWYGYTGLSPEQCVDFDHRNSDVFHPSQSIEIRHKWSDHIAAGKAYSGEMLVRNAAGEYRWHLDMTLPVTDEDGAVDMWIGTLTDVHEQFTSEKKLKETNDLLQTVFDTSIACIEVLECVYDHRYEIVDFTWKYYNHRTGLFLQRQDLLGKRLLQEYPVALKNGLFNRYISVARTGRPLEVELAPFPGTNTWLHVMISKLDDGVVVIYHDITARKQAELRLTENEQELLDLNAMLLQKNNNLETLHKELSHFAFVASHDLREPLRKIRTFADLLVEQEQHLSDKGKAWGQKIIGAATRMDALIDGVLDFSKTSTSQFHQKRLCNMSEILEASLLDMEESIRTTQAQIEYDTLPMLYGNVLQLGQLFQCLIGNALKFRRTDAAPRICITTDFVETGTVAHASAKPGQAYFAVNVADEGIGFDQQYADQLFKIFQRLHQSPAYDGTGIGLAICRKIMENHDGFITARGIEGQGATFTCYFPHKNE